MSAPPPSYNQSTGYNPPPQGQPYPPPGQAYPPPGQAYPPLGQAYPPPGQAYPPPGGQPVTSTVTVVQAGGACPNCRSGYFTDHYGCCAIFLAIFFFPIGILCCLAMKERRCTNCGYGQ